jgi:CubicO group peptidase (beta-lactamase class C family)
VKTLIVALAFILTATLAPARAEPGRHWPPPDPAGWPKQALTSLDQYVAARQPVALMLIHDGKPVAAYGDLARRVDVASIRKSLLSALYGQAVDEGRIDLDTTLGALGIDDKEGLTTQERKATVRDLLSARSGVYLRAAHETPPIRRNRPARGSHPPGSFFFYNNWDFNALGTIYRERTGEDIFAAFARQIAAPIGMEDFRASDGRYALSPASRHPAYPMRVSARDLARFGLLYVDGGRWGGRQVVPRDWVRESTAAHAATDRPSRAYGYLWWALAPERFGPGAALASGFGGHLLAIVPAKKLVLVQTVDPHRNPEKIRTRDALGLIEALARAAP